MRDGRCERAMRINDWWPRTIDRKEALCSSVMWQWLSADVLCGGAQAGSAWGGVRWSELLHSKATAETLAFHSGSIKFASIGLK